MWEGVPLTDEILEAADVAVIVTNHTDVDHARVFEKAAMVVDSRNATRGLVSPPGGQRAGWIVKGPVR